MSFGIIRNQKWLIVKSAPPLYFDDDDLGINVKIHDLFTSGPVNYCGG